MVWNSLSQQEQLEQIAARSCDPSVEAVVVFKHSTRCSISSVAKARLEKAWPFGQELPIFLVDVIRDRAISNVLAENFQVQHESPQLLLIQQGKCTSHTSHLGISIDYLKEALHKQ